MSNIDDMLKKRIKEERLKLEYEQKELADKLGISNRTISKYELGQAKPGYDILVELADLFDCSVDYLLGRTDDRDSNVYSAQIGDNIVNLEIDRRSKDQPNTEEKLNRLVRKLEAVGFDVSKLIGEDIDLDND